MSVFRRSNKRTLGVVEPKVAENVSTEHVNEVPSNRSTQSLTSTSSTKTTKSEGVVRSGSKLIQGMVRSRTKSTPGVPTDNEIPPLPNFTQREIYLAASISEDPPGTILPALPSDLLAALDREAPSKSVVRKSISDPNSSPPRKETKRDDLTPPSDTFSTLPQIPPYSPLSLGTPWSPLASSKFADSTALSRKSPLSTPPSSLVRSNTASKSHFSHPPNSRVQQFDHGKMRRVISSEILERRSTLSSNGTNNVGLGILNPAADEEDHSSSEAFVSVPAGLEITASRIETSKVESKKKLASLENSVGTNNFTKRTDVFTESSMTSPPTLFTDASPTKPLNTVELPKKHPQRYHKHNAEPVVDFWPRKENFTYDLNQIRRRRHHIVRPEDDAASSSSESDDGREEEDGELDHTEDLTVTLERIRSKDLNGKEGNSSTWLLPRAQNDGGMRARLEARRSRIIGDTMNAKLPPDLAVSVILSRATRDNIDSTPKTAPLPMEKTPDARDELRDSIRPASSTESLAGRGRSFSDGALSNPNERSELSYNSQGHKRGMPSDPQHITPHLKTVTGLTKSPLKAKNTYSSTSSRVSSPRRSHDESMKKNPDFVIAVIGPRGVGKTTIINEGLKRLSRKSVVLMDDGHRNQVTSYSASVTFTGSTDAYVADILEVDIAILKYDAEGLIWPRSLPKLDGAMLCYDATDANALVLLKEMLHGFWMRGGTELMVLACKSLPEEGANKADPNRAAEICNVYGRAGIVQLDGGANDEGRKMRSSFMWLFRAIAEHRGGRNYPLPNERRDGGQSHSGRASAEPFRRSLPADFLNQTTSPQKTSFLDTTSNTPPRSADRNSFLDFSPDSIASIQKHATTEENHILNDKFPSDSRPDSDASYPSRPISTSSAIESTSSSAEVMTPSPSETMLKVSKSRQVLSELDLYFSKEDVIDKFLFSAVTGNDEQYVTLFLIVFRRFARPSEVLTKLIERFDFVSGRLQSDPILSRYAHMKLCSALAQWLELYPGDFHAPPTLGALRHFLEKLVLCSWVTHYTVELLPLLRTAGRTPDKESAWALPNDLETDVGTKTEPDRSNLNGASGISTYRESTTNNSEVSDDQSIGSSYHKIDTEDLHGLAPQISNEGGSGSSISASTSINRSSGQDFSTLETSTSDITEHKNKPSIGSRRSSAKTTPTLVEYSTALGGAREDAIALEITRITWENFITIQPRDLIRHVLAPRDPTKPSNVPARDAKSPVTRSISFVNFLSNWVATLILVQSKPKNRVRLTEKFISIAICLRTLENFDALMGVLAGLNSQPIFRLSTMFEALDTRISKKFQSLNRLMATTRGFSAYRLALTTSGSQMIPYLGCHLQDITRLCEGKSDMRNGLVNWSKFQQLGKCSAIVIDCVRSAPVISPDPDMTPLVLDVPVMTLEDNALYNLSYTYKPRQPKTRFRKILDAIDAIQPTTS